MEKERNFNLSPSLYHKHCLNKLKPKFHYNGKNIKQLEKKVRNKIKELIGYELIKKGSLNVRSLWKKKHKHGVIEKIVFTSQPFVDVPAYVCISNNSKPPYPFVICLQGHSTGMHKSIGVQFEDESKPLIVEGDRDYAIGCMKKGIAAICIENRSMGERLEKNQRLREPPSYRCYDASAQALQLGKTLLTERIYDIEKTIEYLYSRKDVDKKRIGILGQSGGGIIAMYASALLPKIKFAIISCSFCTFKDSLMSVNHCICQYVPHILEYVDMSDILGLFAPKPVIVVSGKKDELFPVNGMKKAFKELKKIYKDKNSEKHCHMKIGNEGHRFYVDLVWDVMLKEIKNMN